MKISFMLFVLQVGFVSHTLAQATVQSLDPALFSTEDQSSGAHRINPFKHRDMKLAETVSQMVFDILSTDMGARICQHATQGHVPRLMSEFGLSRTHALQLQDKCKLTQTSLHTSGWLDSELSKLNGETREWWGHSPFEFIVYDGEPPAFQSWTGVRDNFRSLDGRSFVDLTWINLNRQDLDVQNLYRMLAHEIVMRFDYRSQVVSWDVAQSLMDQKKICETMATISHPQIRLAFSTLRAFEIEYQIINQLGLQPTEAENQLNSLACSEKVNWMLPQTFQYRSLLKKEADLVKQNLSQRCAISFEDISFSDLEPTLHSQTNAGTVCQKMIDFTFEPKSRDLFKHSSYFEPGPRPKIGNGSGQTLTSQQIEESMKIDADFLNAFKKPKPQSPPVKDLIRFNHPHNFEILIQNQNNR